VAEHIPQDILEEIRRRNDIVEVIADYLPLKGSAGNYKALPLSTPKRRRPLRSPARSKSSIASAAGPGATFFISS
jgi:hypothetical protein